MTAKQMLVRSMFGLIVAMAPFAVSAASINAGNRDYDATVPFKIEQIATFDTPWALAFLPDGQMLVTEKPGQLFLVSQAGRKTRVDNIPRVAAAGQNGLLDIAAAPTFASDRRIYFSFVEPGDGGSGLALAVAELQTSNQTASLQQMRVIWRQTPKGGGGQPGGIIAFDPQGKHLYLTSGDRMRPTTAQDPDQALGKVLRLNLDGSTPDDNPHAKDGGIRAMTWTLGHRNPYGLAFAGDGRLWMHEMGPRGGDEFNLLEPGANYGWPVVSNGDNYNGTLIPRHATRPDFKAPAVYWTPIVAPAGLVFYDSGLFAEWRGSALVGALGARALIRLTVTPDGSAEEANRWNMGGRIRDVAVAPDGAVWLIEDAAPGRLFRLTPKS